MNMKMKIASLVSTAVIALSTSVVFAHGEHRQDVDLLEHQSNATSKYLNVHGQSRQLIVTINNQSQGHEEIRYNVLQADRYGNTKVVSNGYISPNGNKSVHKYVEEGDYALQLICQSKLGCNATGSIGFFGE
ncbi:hypothetical protein J2Z48_000777 [Croceifilum oryzae]|uniref:Uncharacterized protein n=1 Tax=Croceifilum oryzae TaxID=1553429 RepID=A0AAJ1TL37_9BACL|nr:hypothetical protein [Croceifilum oryzae]MDQ0416610.1 hypothetical protein [Croceifilum oryzae]